MFDSIGLRYASAKLSIKKRNNIVSEIVYFETRDGAELVKKLHASRAQVQTTKILRCNHDYHVWVIPGDKHHEWELNHFEWGKHKDSVQNHVKDDRLIPIWFDGAGKHIHVVQIKGL